MPLMKGARIAVRQCMNVQPGESVLILTDKNMPEEIPRALLKACEEVGTKTVMKTMEPLERDGQEPPEGIAESMKAYDVLFLVTSKSLSHTGARREASKKDVRIASMPSITEFSFTKGGLTADYLEVERLCNAMFKRVKNAKTVRITSPSGTDVRMSVEGRKWIKDTGVFHKKGDFGNLPAGEIFIAPVEGTANGMIIIDRMGEYGEKIRLTARNGYAVKIEGSDKLKQVVNELGENARNIAELGIGTNPKARVIGNSLEDEKVFRTIHFGLGNNIFFGGSVDVSFHVDGIILKPTMEIDGRILIKDGRWILEEESSVEEESEEETYEFTQSEESEQAIKQSEETTGYSVAVKSPYGPYITVKENLEEHYFPSNVLGFARLDTGQAAIRSTLYGIYRKIVRLHERLHLLHNNYSEGRIRSLTSHLMRYGYGI